MNRANNDPEGRQGRGGAADGKPFQFILLIAATSLIVSTIFQVGLHLRMDDPGRTLVADVCNLFTGMVYKAGTPARDPVFDTNGKFVILVSHSLTSMYWVGGGVSTLFWIIVGASIAILIKGYVYNEHNTRRIPAERDEVVLFWFRCYSAFVVWHAILHFGHWGEEEEGGADFGACCRLRISLIGNSFILAKEEILEAMQGRQEE